LVSWGAGGRHNALLNFVYRYKREIPFSWFNMKIFNMCMSLPFVERGNERIGVATRRGFRTVRSLIIMCIQNAKSRAGA
jgi:hypothetical protein